MEVSRIGPPHEPVTWPGTLDVARLTAGGWTPKPFHQFAPSKWTGIALCLRHFQEPEPVAGRHASTGEDPAAPTARLSRG